MDKNSVLSRRKFVKGAAAVTAGGFVLPQFAIGKAGASANSKLNMAFIGVGNRASGHIRTFAESGENIVAFCDVDDRIAGPMYEKFPEVPRFKDFRKMLDKMHKQIDAVVIATPDHTHFAATCACMERGIHVMTEKPLTHNIWQARTLQKAAHYYNVITQMGNQGHATPGIRMVKEWYDFGLVGDVTEVLAAFGGPRFGPGRYFTKSPQYPPAKQPIPEGLDWDLWRGPVVEDVAYNEVYVPKSWRGYYQFGNGELGDWACHTLDAPFWALDLGAPKVVKANLRTESGAGFVPDQSIIEFQFPARGKKSPVKLLWHDGGVLPKVDPKWGVDKWPGGMLMVGEKGSIGTGNRPEGVRLYPDERMALMRKDLSMRPPQTLRRIPGGFRQEWIDAIKGDGPMPGSNFDYASGLTEMTLLGVLAQRFNCRIEWDAEKMQITNKPELNIFVKEPVRKGWEYGEEVWKAKKV